MGGFTIFFAQRRRTKKHDFSMAAAGHEMLVDIVPRKECHQRCSWTNLSSGFKRDYLHLKFSITSDPKRLFHWFSTIAPRRERVATVKRGLPVSCRIYGIGERPASCSTTAASLCCGNDQTAVSRLRGGQRNTREMANLSIAKERWVLILSAMMPTYVAWLYLLSIHQS